MTDFGRRPANEKYTYKYLIPRIISLIDYSNQYRILDLGCGNGYVSACLSEKHDVVGIDHAWDSIVSAERKYKEPKFYIRSEYDDLSGLGMFDVIFTTEFIQHVPDPLRMLENAQSILKKDGKIIISTPYHGYLKNCAISLFNGWDKHFHPLNVDGQIKFFSKNTIYDALFKAGFSSPRFYGVGRVPYLWKSMVITATVLEHGNWTPRSAD